jgi:choline/glycine/proline betaine transport protein
MSFWTGVSTDYQWQFDWTVFYWGWWISWAPFVGMFIARVSKGRTLREFVFGVLLVPSLITFVWISLLGGTALHMELTDSGTILDAVREDVAVALYQTIDMLPVPGEVIAFTGGVAILLIAVYFITSADSGTLVITTIMANGNPEPPRFQRVLWGLGGGALTAVLLIAGGVKALQDAVITAGFPFSLVMIAMVVGILRALGHEKFASVEGQKRRLAKELWTGRDEGVS